MPDRSPPPAPSLERHFGLACALFEPPADAAREPVAGLVILHGAGSTKESHYEFARVACAHGFLALAYDARGHGDSGGRLGPDMVDDAQALCALLGERAPRVALRGSSLGGLVAILAGARADAVVSICPAPGDLLLRGLRTGTLDGFEADRARLDPWLERVDLRAAAAGLSDHGTALMLMHARGDEQVPWTVSADLDASAGEPKRLVLVPGGDHRSVQHDQELQVESLRWLARV